MNERTSPVIVALNDAAYSRGLLEQDLLTTDVQQHTAGLARADLLEVLDYFVRRAHTSLWAARQRAGRGEAS